MVQAVNAAATGKQIGLAEPPERGAPLPARGHSRWARGPTEFDHCLTSGQTGQHGTARAVFGHGLTTVRLFFRIHRGPLAGAERSWPRPTPSLHAGHARGPYRDTYRGTRRLGSPAFVDEYVAPTVVHLVSHYGLKTGRTGP